MPVIQSWREIDRMTSRLEPRLRREFERAIAQLRRQLSDRQLAQAAIQRDVLTAALADVGAVVAVAAQAAARIALTDMGIAAPSFTLVRKASLEAALQRETSAALVRAVTQDIKQAIRLAVRHAIKDGRTMRQTARVVREMVGLGPWQVRALNRQREALAARGWAEARIQREMARRAAKALKYRGELIARTELLRAAHAGQHKVWTVAEQQSRALPGRAPVYRRRWIVTPDSRLCPVCEPLARQERGMREAFVSPRGPSALYPPLHPGCRCAVGLVVSTGRR